MSPTKELAEGSSPAGEEGSVASGTESDIKADDNGGEGRRRRRTFAELDRSYVCDHPNCGRPYASEHSLNQHVRLKHASRSPARRRGLTLPMYMPIPNQNMGGMQGGPPVNVNEAMAHSPAIGRVRGMPYNNPRFPLSRHGSLKDCRLNVATGDRTQGGPMSAHAETGYGSSSQPGSPGGGRIHGQRLSGHNNNLAWSAVGGFGHDNMNNSNTSSPRVDRIERMRMNAGQSPMASLSMGNLPMRMPQNNMATSLENFQQLRDSTNSMNSWNGNTDLQMQQQQRQFNQGGQPHGGSAAQSRNNSVLDLMGANFVAVVGQDQAQEQQMQMQQQQYQQQQMQQRQQFAHQQGNPLSASNSFGSVAQAQSHSFNNQSFGNNMQSMSSDSLSQQSNNLRAMLNNPLINPPSQTQQQVNRLANQNINQARANSWNPNATEGAIPNFSASREDLMVNSAGMLETGGENSMPGSRNTSTSNLINPYSGNNMLQNNGPNQFNQQQQQSGAAPGYSSPMSISASNLESVIQTLSNSSSLSDVSQFGRASPAHNKVLSSSNLSHPSVQHQRSAGSTNMYGMGGPSEGMSTLADETSAMGRPNDIALQKEMLDHLKNLV